MRALWTGQVTLLYFSDNDYENGMNERHSLNLQLENGYILCVDYNKKL